MIPKSGNRFSDNHAQLNWNRLTCLPFRHTMFALTFFGARSCAGAKLRRQAALWPDAQAKGITRANFDLALQGVTPDPRVIAATKRQPEYGKPVGAYVNDAVSAGRIKRGQAKANEWSKTFDAVEKKFGVERWVLLALWGMETDYGAARDKWDVFRSLATLGYVKYRHPYFATSCWSPCASCRTTNSCANKW